RGAPGPDRLPRGGPDHRRVPPGAREEEARRRGRARAAAAAPAAALAVPGAGRAHHSAPPHRPAPAVRRPAAVPPAAPALRRRPAAPVRPAAHVRPAPVARRDRSWSRSRTGSPEPAADGPQKPRVRLAARRFSADPIRRCIREISDPRFTPIAMAIARATACERYTSPVLTSFCAIASSPKYVAEPGSSGPIAAVV